MELSPEEKKRIYEEEKVRLGVQEEAKAKQEKAEAKNLRQGCLGCLGLIVVISLIFIICARRPDPDPKISSEDWRVIKDEIVTMFTKGSIAEFIYPDEVVYNPEIVRVSINFKQAPESMAEVEFWTNPVASDVVRVLLKHNIEGVCVSVWGQSRLPDEMIRLYGRTFYSSFLKTYEFTEK